MDRNKILLIFGAAWVSAALLIWFLYATTTAPRAEKTVAVIAAARDLPAGTLLHKSDIKTIALRANEVPRAAVLSEKLALNHPLLLPVSAGEFLTIPKLGAGGIEGLPATIEKGKRAVTVAINDASGVAGLIPPRAHVDVLFTRPGSATEAVTSTIIEDVVVLAMGRVTEVTPTQPTSSSSSSAAAQAAAARTTAQSATLLVTPEQARRIELAKNLGKISLSLRNPLDDTATPEDEATATTPDEIGIIPPAPPMRAAPRVVQVASPKPPPPAKPKTVEVFHGAVHEQQAFRTGGN